MARRLKESQKETRLEKARLARVAAGNENRRHGTVRDRRRSGCLCAALHRPVEFDC